MKEINEILALIERLQREIIRERIGDAGWHILERVNRHFVKALYKAELV